MSINVHLHCYYSLKSLNFRATLDLTNLLSLTPFRLLLFLQINSATFDKVPPEQCH